MASPLVWEAFGLHRRIYDFVYRSPIQMKIKERRIFIEKPTLKHITWILANSVIAGFSTISLYAFTRELYAPSGKVPMVTLSIYINLFAATLFYLGMNAAIIFGSEKEASINQLIVWSEGLQRGNQSFVCI